MALPDRLDCPATPDTPSAQREQSVPQANEAPSLCQGRVLQS